MQLKSRYAICASIIFFLFLAASCGTVLKSKPGTTTTVILIRHANRDEAGHLTPRGRERARSLVAAVGNMGISAIYSPNLERNINTVKPLADHLGLDITLTPKVSLFQVGRISKEILTKHAGEVVLWVGNVSGNLQAIYHRLGGEGRGPLDYGQLYILRVPDQGATQVTKSTF